MAIEQLRLLRVEGRAVDLETVTTGLVRVTGAAARVTAGKNGMVTATIRAAVTVQTKAQQRSSTGEKLDWLTKLSSDPR